MSFTKKEFLRMILTQTLAMFWIASPDSTLALEETPISENITLRENPTQQYDRSAQTESLKDILEAGNKKIEKVEITVNPIFDLSNPNEDNWLFRLANQLHPLTRTKVVADDLLFVQGDDLNQDLIDASERLLNTRRYLGKASIAVENNEDAAPIVKVDVRDVWTFKPQYHFSRSGGNNKYSYGIEDTNFLGSGKGLTISRYQNSERSGSVFEYFDPNTGAYNSRLLAKYADNEDGKQIGFSLIRPFLDFSTEWSGGFEFKDSNSDQSLYSRGDTVEQFQHVERASSIYFGKRLNSFYNDNGERTTTRFLVGVTRENDEFYLHENKLSNPIFNVSKLPKARLFNTAWIEYQSLNDGYIKTSNTLQINRTEYINLGQQARFRLGYYHTGFADNILTNSRYGDQGLLFQSEYSIGALLPVRDMVLSSIGIKGRYSDDGFLFDSTLDAEIGYFWRNMDRGQMVFKVQGARGFNLYKDKPLELGGDTGMRGFPAHYQAGDKRFVLNVEQHFFGEKEWFSLFHAGVAMFIDVGRAWGESGVTQDDSGLLKDYGIGLRLSGTRTGNREEGAHNVLHIDVSKPIGTYPDDVSGFQLRIGAERQF